MGDQEIFIIRREGPVAWFIFNRPEKRNIIRKRSCTAGIAGYRPACASAPRTRRHWFRKRMRNEGLRIFFLTGAGRRDSVA